MAVWAYLENATRGLPAVTKGKGFAGGWMVDEIGCGRFIGPYPCCTIVTGDCRELAPAIPDESVDLIFTDPVYDRIEDYRWLAETAARVLRYRGICFAYCWGTRSADVTQAMTIMGLVYRSPVFDLKIGFASLDGGANRRVMSRPAHVWSRGSHDNSFWLSDVVYSRPAGRTINYAINHEWSKNPSACIAWLSMIPAGLTVDFFAGGGTVPAVCKMLGRHYLAFEIEPDVAERAREWVRNTQPPLFVAQPEQMRLE